MKTLMVCVSMHNGCTQKIAKRISKVLDAKLIDPVAFAQENLDDYDMIGFGSGIYDNTFHPLVADLVDSEPTLEAKKVFLFSTAGVLLQDAHISMRAKVTAKNAEIVGEFRCKGFNTNSFLKCFGGMNKGRPNDDDVQRAQDFAQSLNL